MGVAALALAACGEMATLPVSAGTGPQPTLPPPQPTLIPTVNIAPAKGWPPGRDAAGGAGHARGRVRQRPGPPALAATCCPTAMCWWRRPMPRPSPTTRKGIKGWVDGPGDEAGGRRRAQRQPHHAAARHRWRRRGRPALGAAGRAELAVRHGAGGQRSLRGQLRRGAALSLRRRRHAHHGARRQGGGPAGRADQPPLDQEPHRQRRTAPSST